MNVADQVYWLIILSLAVASVSWTVTQEEIFREPREAAGKRSRAAKSMLVRKFFYVFTCEYCFSHWVTLFFLIITGYQLVFEDWRGYLIAFFVLPWIANQWMSLYRRLRVGIKHEDALAEQELDELENEKGKKK